MARITTNRGPFTGHVGVVRFDKGEGETDNVGALAFFRDHPDYAVHEGDEQPEAPTEPTEVPTENPEGEPDPDESVADYIARTAGQDEQTPEPVTEDESDETPTEGDDTDEPPAEDETPSQDEQPAEAPAPEADPYDLSVAELRKLCSLRSIPQAGSKADLQERLRAHDIQGA